MSGLDSRNFEQGQIGQPTRTSVDIVGAVSSHGNSISSNRSKVSDVLPSSDSALAGSSFNELRSSKNEDTIDSSGILSAGSSRCFSLDEVLTATNNFDDDLVIGNGGFGKVYKGFIDADEDGATIVVAIKRLNAESKQGAGEFWTEVKMLSKLRHTHLVALIGYCNESQEMILVYEYIARGTLADHLYKVSSRTDSGKSIPPLTWEHRLNICIGAARGLDYLHSGTDQSFIHRDVKTTNILLDENWAAKIADFGLSKGTTSNSITHISTAVKGTFGYLDPDYFITQRLTTKSDVYAFGVVLLEVLCGRQPVDRRLDDDQISLAHWAQHCIKKGKLDRAIDPSLTGQIVPRCLKTFVVVANNCLHKSPKSRPSMAEVLVRLELALLSQQKGRTEGIITKAFQSMDRLLRKDISSSSGQSKDSPQESKDSPRESSSKSVTQVYHQFSLAEIRVATNDFSKNLVVHNSDNVYKGSVNIDGKTLVVAIKRFNKVEALGVEILTKIQFLHPNIVSPIGFCTEEHELILVYDYMFSGSLQDYLFPLDPPIMKGRLPSLTWERRLNICLGTAQALEYLQVDTERNLIYRHIKPSNILLDENFVAKFILPHIRGTNNSNATIIRSGTTHFDSADDPAEDQEDDLYSFGVTMLEVLTGDQHLDMYRNRKHRDVPLLRTFKNILQSENINDVIDLDLTGKIGPECLRQFVKITLSCLFEQGNRRPPVDYIVRCLQFAVHLQQTWENYITKYEDQLQSSLNKDIFANIGQSAANQVPGYGWTEGPFGPIFRKL